ncbi:GEVED domain-containing protein, partial [Streptococcus mitis]|uniref:GEVED domain-containing protein n=1 Tax=Streptococcus mitis TaxID=28037 RepID=UPI0020007DB0
MKGKQQDFRTEKYIRYGIRKYSFGAASVAIAAGLMFLGNGAVSATEVQSAETAISTPAPSQDAKDKEKAELKAETVETVKPEVKAEEAKKVNKAILEASIATLESKLSTAKYADDTVVSSAKEVLATAKATLAKLDASQADVDAQAETVSALSTVVTESNTAGFDKKQAAEKEAAKAEAEKKATPAETALSVAKTALTQVSSEAEVTNKLAETELAKADVKEENKAAVTAAVAKNQAVLAETKALLADKSVTKEQVDAQLERLNESILAVYNELKNAGIGRDGKFSVNLDETQTTGLKDATTETGKKWLADHGYSSLADVPIKNDRAEISKLNDQIQWINFSDKTAWTNLKENGQLQVGSQFRKTLIPGYEVTMTVKALRPFESTEVYKNRVAGTAHAGTYDPYKENKFKNATGIGGNSQHPSYTNVRERGNGINTGNAKTVLTGVNDKGSAADGTMGGVLFTVEATYHGKPVKPGIVMTSGEDISAGKLEAEIYTTNGTPWDLAGVIGGPRGTKQYLPTPDFKNMNEKDKIRVWNSPEIVKAVEAGMFATRDAATAGLGSQVFGSYSNGGNYATPIVSTANVTEVGFYILASGQQASMVGVKFSDFGDLPESYGTAEHYLKTQTLDLQTNTIRQIQQPYLGTEKADIDSAPGKRVRGIDSDDQNDNPDEGVKQLIDPADVHNNVDTREPEVKLVKGPDNTYEVNIKASVNGNDSFKGTPAPAYVRGFIDFNHNGKFDEGEASEIVTVTEKDQKVKLTFTNTQIVDTTKEVVNFRVRIGTERSQIEKPVGIAFDGEVEDNQIQVALPPRGDKEETTGAQGETQSIDFEFVNRAEGDDATNVGSGNGKTTFNSYGKIYYSNQRNSISLETTKVKQSEGVMIVGDNGNLVKTYTKAGQGKYEVTDTGVTFTPEANFVGKADGVALRAVDANGQTTGWKALTEKNGLVNNNTGIHSTTELTMDAVYIPNVTPKQITGEPKTSIDVQGKEQKETVVFKTDSGKATEVVITPSTTSPAKLIDPVTKVPTDAKTVTVDGEGTYTINPETGEVTFQPLPTFTGKAKGIGVSLTAPVGVDKTGAKVTSTATTTYTPEVTPVKPTAEPATSTGLQGETQTGKPTFTEGDAEVPIKAGSVKLLNANGTEAQGAVPALDPNGNKVGEYTVDPATGVVTFTPTDKTYVGPVVPAKVQAEDNNGTKVETKYTPSIVGVKPTATPAESSNIQGEAQSGTVAFAPGKATIEGVEKSVAIKPNSAVLLDKQGNPVMAGTPVDAEDANGNKVGEYTINPATNTVTFTPTDKTYTGTVVPANVQAEDENGTTVKTTYTPHIVGVVPTAEPATSTDIQGVEQSKEVTFTPGKTEINGTEKTVAIDTTSFKLLDENENAVDSVPAKNPAGDVIGTYTLKVVYGKVNAVFTPTDKTYAGEVEPVTIQAKDTNGTVVKTTYTPSITPVEPSGTPTTSEGIQGAKQEGTPSFTPGDERIPMKIDADQPAKLVNPETGKPIDDTTIPAKDNDGNTVGTYTIEPTTGKVTFTPNKDFTGTPVAATVQAKDANGTPTTATYEPTVKPVTPTGSDTVTEDVQGSIQKGKPTFEGGTVTVNGEEKTVAIDEDKPAKLVDPKTGDPVESVTIDGEGTYTVTPDGIVTFTPEKNFTGKGTGVTVQREDKNATPVTAKYTPVVKPATPTSSDVITTNVQGAIQEGTPTFTGGKVTINGQEKTVAIDEAVKPKFDDGTTEKVVPNEGTYTIDENGKVTFTPEKTFTGQAAGVTVKRVDKNGTPVTAKYTPVVIPVSPTSKDAESEGPKGQSQEGTPTFTGGKVTLNGKEVPVAIDENVKPKFDDGTTEKVVPNEGTYTIDENGKVTFTPEPNFVGKATGVTVKRVDKNGTPVTAKYTPTVRPDTRFVVIEKDGKETDLLPSKDGAKPSEPIPGYNVVRTEIDEKGNTKHIYEKVKTSFKDKEGNEIPKYPSEPGTVDKKDIPEYRFVETKKLPNGDTEHIYEKVKTSFKDKEGNEIPKYPSEPGTVDKKDIPEYRFVETKKLPNGDTEHIYEKVKTSFKDKEGNEIPKYPSEPGTVDKKDIPEYRFVETKKLPNGDT